MPWQQIELQTIKLEHKVMKENCGIQFYNMLL